MRNLALFYTTIKPTIFNAKIMAQFKKTKYDNIPDWALCALEYGTDECDNLTNEDIQMVHNFQQQFKRGYVMDVNWDTLGFSAYPAFGLACDTY